MSAPGWTEQHATSTAANCVTGRAQPRSSRCCPRAWPAEAEGGDRAVYAAVAKTSTPLLDDVMRRLSSAADYSRLSAASAAILAIFGGPPGRRAAGLGLASVAATSAVVNLVVKQPG